MFSLKLLRPFEYYSNCNDIGYMVAYLLPNCDAIG